MPPLPYIYTYFIGVEEEEDDHLHSSDREVEASILDGGPAVKGPVELSCTLVLLEGILMS